MDLCRVLEIINPSDVASRLDDDEKITLAITEGIRGNPNMVCVNESGFYSLVFGSCKLDVRKSHIARTAKGGKGGG